MAKGEQMFFIFILSVIITGISAVTHIYLESDDKENALTHNILFTLVVLVMYMAMFITYNFECHYNDANKVELYLNTKYSGNNFTYVSEESENSWTKYYTYSDKNGNQFKVQFWQNEQYSDNYCSVLFDDVANKNLKEKYPSDFKLFVNTELEFFNASGRFENYNEYLKNCHSINACVYTTKIPYEYNEIVETLSELFKEYSFSIDVYTVSEETYNYEDSYGDSVRALNSRSYLIANGNVKQTN